MKSMLFALSLISLSASASNLVSAKSLTIAPSADLRGYSEKGPVSDQLTAYGSSSQATATCLLDLLSTKGLQLNVSSQQAKMIGTVYSFSLASQLVLTTTDATSSIAQVKAACSEPEFCDDQVYNQQTVVLKAVDANANNVVLVCVSTPTPIGQPIVQLKTSDLTIQGVSAD